MGVPTLPDEVVSEPIRILDTPELKAFWHFATEVRRTRRLTEFASARIAGVWLTPNLVIEGIHGWSKSCVRLLCIRAHTDEHRGRLRQFLHLRSFNSGVYDPPLASVRSPRQTKKSPHDEISDKFLEEEERLVIKVPFNRSLGRSVDREFEALWELRGLPGVPTVLTPIVFEDLGVRAAVYRYQTGRTLQACMESGSLSMNIVHKVVLSTLSVLERVHEMGWLHTNLRPQDVLLLPITEDEVCACRWADDRELVMLCGWSEALRIEDGACGQRRGQPGGELLAHDSLRETLSAMSQHRRIPRAPSAAVVSRVAGQMRPEEGRLAAGHEDADAAPGLDVNSLSLYSPPEQILGMFTGMRCETASTDIYRVAAILLVLLDSHGPYGRPGCLTALNVVRRLRDLRELCHRAILRRSKAAEWACCTLMSEISSSASWPGDGETENGEYLETTDRLRKLLESFKNHRALPISSLDRGSARALEEEAARAEEEEDVLSFTDHLTALLNTDFDADSDSLGVKQVEENLDEEEKGWAADASADFPTRSSHIATDHVRFIDAELGPFFKRCLARDPQGRSRCVGEIREQLEELWPRFSDRLLADRRRKEEAGMSGSRMPHEPLELPRPTELMGMQIL